LRLAILFNSLTTSGIISSSAPLSPARQASNKPVTFCDDEFDIFTIRLSMVLKVSDSGPNFQNYNTRAKIYSFFVIGRLRFLRILD
jgi:hypothetical protein